MFSPRLLLALAIGATAGCAVTPAAPPASSADRSIQVARQVRVPTLEEMKKLVPSRLTAEEAARSLTRVPQSKIFLPSAERRTKIHTYLGGLGWGLGLSPFYSSILLNPIASIYGFYPFSFHGADFWAPFLWNPLALAYTPFISLSPILSAYPYFATPFIGSLGCGFAPYTYAIGTLGCDALGLGFGTGLIL